MGLEMSVSRILLGGWQQIVETLTDIIAQLGFASFFAVRQPPTTTINHVKENASRILEKVLGIYSFFYLPKLQTFHFILFIKFYLYRFRRYLTLNNSERIHLLKKY